MMEKFFNTFVISTLGLILIASLTFKPFSLYSNLIGPLGMILVVGPQVIGN